MEGCPRSTSFKFAHKTKNCVHKHRYFCTCCCKQGHVNRRALPLARSTIPAGIRIFGPRRAEARRRSFDPALPPGFGAARAKD
eukprot:14696959-Alexandrium_andersonii.AAC.1